MNALKRNGIKTRDELIEAIKKYGLLRSGQSYYFADSNAPSLGGVGAVAWIEINNFLNEVGFDWQYYVNNPRQWRSNLSKKEPPSKSNIDNNIKKLIELLELYFKMNDINLPREDV